MSRPLCVAPMRLTLAAVALVVAVGPGWAQSASVKVDRVWSTGSFLHVLGRVKNEGSQAISEANVECGVFDAQQQALGTNGTYPKQIGAGQSVAFEVGMSAPPNSATTSLTADCRVVSVE